MSHFTDLSLNSTDNSYYMEPVISRNEQQFFGRPLFSAHRRTPPSMSDREALNFRIDDASSSSATTATESGYLSPVISPTCSLIYSSTSSSSGSSSDSDSFGPSTPIACSTLPATHDDLMSSTLDGRCLNFPVYEPLSIIIDSNESACQFVQDETEVEEPLLMPRLYFGLPLAEKSHYQGLLVRQRHLQPPASESSPVSVNAKRRVA